MATFDSPAGHLCYTDHLIVIEDTLGYSVDLPIPQGEAARALPQPGKRTVRNGVTTNDLVLSAYMDSNEAVFPKIMALYVKPGSIVADVTYGKGVFWRCIPPDRYDLR